MEAFLILRENKEISFANVAALAFAEFVVLNIWSKVSMTLKEDAFFRVLYKPLSKQVGN